VISITDALVDIISGELRDSTFNSAFQYLYALELLCQHLGSILDGGDSIGHVENVAWNTKLLTPRTPFALPEPQDFPEVSYLTATEVADEYRRLDAECEESIEPLENELEDAREDFLWWLKQCSDKGLGLVTFYH
jgi:hypothetical protein